MPMHAALDGPRPDGNVEPQIHPDLRECAYCSNYRLAEGGPPPSDLSTSPSIEERSRLAALIDDKFLILHGENGVYCEVKDTEWHREENIRKSKFPELERELALHVSRLLSVCPDDAAYNGLIASDAGQLLSDNTVPVNVREYFQLPSNV
ncbi:hypothetical protein FOZ60_010457 [Perkinsus olseni]|uniref:Uncharacterized protein n=1 Tax=Perkinsus olseni TaxID=32597 RepID=A0A7J6NFA7_PEROL|nr:hypothetical protein FOZ60_010457 [Perkinsus olseni]KAF4703510.1 hypothetical protein FOZ62_030849 [Perkinsus olseni]